MFARGPLVHRVVEYRIGDPRIVTRIDEIGPRRAEAIEDVARIGAAHARIAGNACAAQIATGKDVVALRIMAADRQFEVRGKVERRSPAPAEGTDLDKGCEPRPWLPAIARPDTRP